MENLTAPLSVMVGDMATITPVRARMSELRYYWKMVLGPTWLCCHNTSLAHVDGKDRIGIAMTDYEISEIEGSILILCAYWGET